MLWFNTKKETVTMPQCDFHNHLLPGVDDGFKDEDHSIDAIKLMMEAGIKHIIFTPHMNPDVYHDSSEQLVKDRYKQFKSIIPKEWNIDTDLAAEYMIVNGFEDRASDPDLLTYPDGTSILIEMSYYFRSKNLEQTIFELNLAGKKPILAHPERYVYMVNSLKDFDKLQDMGCRFQMNWMSLTGMYGKDSMKILKHLLTHNMYSFICTDLHTMHQFQRIQEIEVDMKTKEMIEQLKEKMNGAGF